MQPNERIQVLREAYAGRRPVRRGALTAFVWWLLSPCRATHYYIALIAVCLALLAAMTARGNV